MFEARLGCEERQMDVTLLDVFQILRDHMKLSSRENRLMDKMKVMILPLLKVWQMISKQLPDTSAGFERKILSMVDCRGVIVNMDGIDYVLRDYESFIIVGPRFERWIWKHLKPRKGETFVDVGAHIGKYALHVAKIVGESGQVVAVEADPENFKALRKGVRLNGLNNVRVLNLAAWNKVDRLKLYRATSSGRSSVKGTRGLDCVDVEALPLDNVLGKSRVDWIKMDVEGVELETLEGLNHTLQQYHPTVVAEVAKCNMKEVTAFMRKKGYGARIIYEGTTGNHVLFSAGTTKGLAEDA